MKTLPSAFLLLLATASSADAALRGSSMGSRQLASTTGGAAVGGWECWTTNGIPTTTVSYGFSTTDGQTTSQSHKQDLSATAKVGFSMAGASGSVSITGSIGRTWGTAIKHSKTESSTTTITTQCPPEFCPSSGEARTANICQWTVSNDVAKFASKTILFAPTGKSPQCVVHPVVPGTWCDMEHDSYCSRCTQQACTEHPGMPGCEWYAYVLTGTNHGTYTFKAGESKVMVNNKKNSWSAPNGALFNEASTTHEWIAYKKTQGRWESGDENGAWMYLEGKAPVGKEVFPPAGNWTPITDLSNRGHVYKMNGKEYFVVTANFGWVLPCPDSDSCNTVKSSLSPQPGRFNTKDDQFENFVATTIVRTADAEDWLAYTGAPQKGQHRWVAGNGSVITGYLDVPSDVAAANPNFPPKGTWIKNSATSGAGFWKSPKEVIPSSGTKQTWATGTVVMNTAEATGALSTSSS